jgi:cell wall-associated NlpC family hydrolase/peptidoglycan hydrolase CwlO-like protein
MSRRVNPVILLGIIVVAVLSFGLSAGAAPEDGTVSEDIPGKDAAPNEGTAPDGAPDGGPALAEEVPASDAPEGNIAPEGGSVPDNAAPHESASQDKDNATPAEQKDATSEESLVQKNAESDPVKSDSGKSDSAGSDTPEEEAQVGEAADEVGQEFQKMLDEAGVTDRAYNDALSKENQLTRKIAETRNDLKVAEDNRDEAQESLEKRERQIYMDGQDGYLGVLLGAKDVRELPDLWGLWVKLIDQDQDEVEKWRDSSDQLKQSSQDLETQLDDWEQTRKEAAAKEEEAENSVNQAQEFFKAQDGEIQTKIEEDRAREEELALDHISKTLEGGTQQEEPSLGKEEQSDETTTDEQASQADEGSNKDTAVDEQTSQTETGELERTPEKEKVVQPEVAQALTKTIEEWKAQKKPLEEAVEEPVNGPVLENKTNDNPAAKQLADAAEEKAKAQDQDRQATEQAAAEKAAQEDAATQADKAKEAKIAAQQAPASEQERAQTAADEAARKAALAAEQADQKKQAAEEAAKQATDKQSFAMELWDAATQKATEDGMLGPKPTSGALGSGGAVLDEAKEWLGVPYDYTHRGGMSRRGVDCSAFTAAVYKEFGITLPDDPAAQYGMGTPVIGDPKAGDLVFFNENGAGISHVGIANGDGTLTHASDFTGEVSVTPLKYLKGYAGARRFF